MKFLTFSKEEMHIELMKRELCGLSEARHRKVIAKLEKEFAFPMQVPIELLRHIIKETK